MAQSTGPARALIFLVLAVVASVAALAVVWMLIQKYQEQLDSADAPENVVFGILASRTLYQGLTITEEDLVYLEIPQKYFPEKGFHDKQQVVGQVPKERILANEFIRTERLANATNGTGLNAIISRGMRAISIDISNGAALSGFLQPGNYVDVLVTITPEAEDLEPQTRTILQAVYVLAVHGRTQDDNPNVRARRPSAPSVTLQVTPEQAEQLAHAKKQGQIFLLLRNDLDLAINATPGVTMKSLLGEEEKPVIKRRKPKPKTELRIYQGTRERHYEYDTK